MVQAEPDGHTLYVAAISEISIAPATVKSLPYDPDKNLAPVAMFGKWAQILVASPSFQPNTLSELVAHVKANPGKVSYSSFGNNTLNHINGERFKSAPVSTSCMCRSGEADRRSPPSWGDMSTIRSTRRARPSGRIKSATN